jgi:hypothetical protein
MIAVFRDGDKHFRLSLQFLCPKYMTRKATYLFVGERFIYTVLARDARRWYSSGLNEQVPHGFHVCAGK